MRRKYLLGATTDREIVFGEFEITTRNGYPEFSASFDTVRPFDGDDYNLEEYFIDWCDCMDKATLYDMCERLYCSPQDLPKEYLCNFREWAKAEGLPGLYVVANISKPFYQEEQAKQDGYDAISHQRLASNLHEGNTIRDKIIRQLQIRWKKIKGILFHRPPFMEDYSKCYHSLIRECDKKENVIPVLLPQWDHTPRSGWNGSLLVNATPSIFYKHINEALAAVREKTHPILFLKSWNEWGEGNYMEPCIKYGHGYIQALRRALEEEN
jgi:hypothetical protein